MPAEPPGAGPGDMGYTNAAEKIIIINRLFGIRCEVGRRGWKGGGCRALQRYNLFVFRYNVVYAVCKQRIF
jgi:hypothetical protein